MNTMDYILLVIILCFVFIGFKSGFIEAIGALIGLVIGAWFAGQKFILVSVWLAKYLHINDSLLKILSFIAIFILINRGIGIIFWLIDKIFHIIAIIPFLESINTLAGGFLGLVEGVFFLGLVLYIVGRYPFSAWLTDGVAASKVGAWLIHSANLLVSLLPEAVKTIQTII